MFLITGITGKVGGAPAKHLLAQGKQLRALVRDEAKAKTWADRGVELLKGEPRAHLTSRHSATCEDGIIRHDYLMTWQCVEVGSLIA